MSEKLEVWLWANRHAVFGTMADQIREMFKAERLSWEKRTGEAVAKALRDFSKEINACNGSTRDDGKRIETQICRELQKLAEKRAQQALHISNNEAQEMKGATWLSF